MKSFLTTLLLLSATVLNAETVHVTFQGVPTGVNDGVDYVAPYSLTVDGVYYDATCYDFFHSVTFGQSWNAKELTLSEAIAHGQFSGLSNASLGYRQIGFLAFLSAPTSLDQIDLQHVIWNVFAPDTFSVTPNMQSYLDLLSTSAFATYDYRKVVFLEDVSNSSNHAQSFVIDPPVAAPEPSYFGLILVGLSLITASSLRRRTYHLANRHR